MALVPLDEEIAPMDQLQATFSDLQRLAQVPRPVQLQINPQFLSGMELPLLPMEPQPLLAQGSPELLDLDPSNCYGNRLRGAQLPAAAPSCDGELRESPRTPSPSQTGQDGFESQLSEVTWGYSGEENQTPENQPHPRLAGRVEDRLQGLETEIKRLQQGLRHAGAAVTHLEVVLQLQHDD